MLCWQSCCWSCLLSTSRWRHQQHSVRSQNLQKCYICTQNQSSREFLCNWTALTLSGFGWRYLFERAPPSPPPPRTSSYSPPPPLFFFFFFLTLVSHTWYHCQALFRGNMGSKNACKSGHGLVFVLICTATSVLGAFSPIWRIVTVQTNTCFGCVCFFCPENMCISWLCHVRKGTLHATTQNVFSTEALFSTQSLCFPHKAYVFHIKPMFSTQRFCFPHRAYVFHIKPMFSTQRFCFPHRAYVFHIKPMFSTQRFCFPHRAYVFHIKPMFSTQRFCFPHRACFPHKAYVFHTKLMFSTQSLCFPHKAYVFHTKVLFSTQSLCFPHKAYVFHTKVLFSTQGLCFPHKAYVFHTKVLFSTQSLCFPHRAYVFHTEPMFSTTSILNVCSGGLGAGGSLLWVIVCWFLSAVHRRDSVECEQKTHPLFSLDSIPARRRLYMAKTMPWLPWQHASVPQATSDSWCRKRKWPRRESECKSDIESLCFPHRESVCVCACVHTCVPACFRA